MNFFLAAQYLWGSLNVYREEEGHLPFIMITERVGMCSVTNTFLHHLYNFYLKTSPYGVVAYDLDCNIVGNDFELRSC